MRLGQALVFKIPFQSRRHRGLIFGLGTCRFIHKPYSPDDKTSRQGCSKKDLWARTVPLNGGIQTQRLYTRLSLCDSLNLFNEGLEEKTQFQAEPNTSPLWNTDKLHLINAIRHSDTRPVWKSGQLRRKVIWCRLRTVVWWMCVSLCWFLSKFLHVCKIAFVGTTYLQHCQPSLFPCCLSEWKCTKGWWHQMCVSSNAECVLQPIVSAYFFTQQECVWVLVQQPIIYINLMVMAKPVFCYRQWNAQQQAAWHSAWKSQHTTKWEVCIWCPL